MNQLPYQCSMNALVAVALYDKKERERLTAEEVQKQQLLKENREISLYAILEDVCLVFRYDINRVKSKSRMPALVLCRRMYCHIARCKTKHSFPDIAKEICFYDHTSVIHHCRKVKKLFNENDPDFMINWRYYLYNSKLFTQTDF